MGNLTHVRNVPCRPGMETRDLKALPTHDGRRWPYYISSIMLNFTVRLTPQEGKKVARGELPRGVFHNLIQGIRFRDNVGRNIIFDNPIPGRVVRTLASYANGTGYDDPQYVVTDKGIYAKFGLTIPFRLPYLLRDADLHLMLAARLQSGFIELTCADSILDGYDIDWDATNCDVMCDLVASQRYEAGPELLFGAKTPDSWDRYRLPIGGRILVWALTKSCDGLIPATDFQQVEIRGTSIDINRQSIDSQTMLYNSRFGFGSTSYHPSEKPLPSLGHAREIPLYVSLDAAKISQAPLETSPTITLTGGLGQDCGPVLPPLHDYLHIYIVSRAKDLAMVAESIGQSDSIHLTTEQARAGFHGAVSIGRNGEAISRRKAVWSHGRSPLNLINAGVKS